MISVREVQSSSELSELEGTWNELLARTPSRNVFMTHEWMTTWWEHFGGGRQLLVLVLEEGREVVGIVPWWIGRTERVGGVLRKVGFLGTGLSDYLDVILPDPTAEALDAILAVLQAQRTAWDYLDLREMPEISETARALAERFADRPRAIELRPDSRCAYIPIESDWNTYYKSRMGKRSREHARMRRKRLRDAGEAEVRLIEDLQGDLKPIEKIAAMPESDTYDGERRKAVFAQPRIRAFLEEISLLFSERGWLHLATLELNGATIGYHYGFLYGQKYLHYVTGFDPAHRRLAPGRVLMDKILEQCFERALREVDFLRGFEAWKSSFTDQARENQRLLLYGSSIRGRLARILSGAARSWGR